MLLAAGITIVLNSQKKKPKKETASGKKGNVAIPNAPSLTRIPLPPLWVLDPSSTHSLTHSHTHSLTHSLSLSLSRFLSGEIVSKLQSFIQRCCQVYIPVLHCATINMFLHTTDHKFWVCSAGGHLAVLYLIKKGSCSNFLTRTINFVFLWQTWVYVCICFTDWTRSAYRMIPVSLLVVSVTPLSVCGPSHLVNSTQWSHHRSYSTWPCQQVSEWVWVREREWVSEWESECESEWVSEWRRGPVLTEEGVVF